MQKTIQTTKQKLEETRGIYLTMATDYKRRADESTESDDKNFYRGTSSGFLIAGQRLKVVIDGLIEED